MTTRPMPTMEIAKTALNGKPAIELIVRNSCFGGFGCKESADLCSLLDTLGILPTPDIYNRRGLICTTPTALDAARNPLRAYFDAKGNYINQ